MYPWYFFAKFITRLPMGNSLPASTPRRLFSISMIQINIRITDPCDEKIETSCANPSYQMCVWMKCSTMNSNIHPQRRDVHAMQPTRIFLDACLCVPDEPPTKPDAPDITPTRSIGLPPSARLTSSNTSSALYRAAASPVLDQVTTPQGK